ncbi:unnamed protein product [Camellia sinensis]
MSRRLSTRASKKVRGSSSSAPPPPLSPPSSPPQPVDEAQDPVHDQPPPTTSPVPSQGDPFYMTREEYLQFQHSVDQVHNTLHDHHQILIGLRMDFQAHRDYSQATFE